MTREDSFVADFLDSAGTKIGVGVFRESSRAAFFANSLGKVKRRKCQRYGLVPVELLQFMKEEGQLKSSYPVPQKSISREEFRDVVKNHCVTLHVKGDHDDTRDDQRIRREMAPELNKAFGTQDQVWEAIERSRILKSVRKPR